MEREGDPAEWEEGAKAWPRSARGLVKMPKSQPRVRAFIHFVGEKKKI